MLSQNSKENDLQEINKQKLVGLRKQFESVLNGGLVRLDKSIAHSASAQKEELRYLLEKNNKHLDKITGSVADTMKVGVDEIKHSIQKLENYLGAKLNGIKETIQYHTSVSENILKVLYNSISNESRQHYEEGIKCYQKGVRLPAKREFLRAVDASPTNYLAYLCLGFMEAEENEYQKAVEYFDLAEKFSDHSPDNHKLAVANLALNHHLVGENVEAIRTIRKALDLYPDNTEFSYDLAKYKSFAGFTHETISILRNLIENDWEFWGKVISDPDFDHVRDSIDRLLDNLREEQKRIARDQIDGLRYAIETALKSDVNSNSLPLEEIDELENKLSENSVFGYRQISRRAEGLRQEIFIAIKTTFVAKIRNIEIVGSDLSAKHNEEKGRISHDLDRRKRQLLGLSHPIETIREWGEGDALWVVIFYTCFLALPVLVVYFAFIQTPYYYLRRLFLERKIAKIEAGIEPSIKRLKTKYLSDDGKLIGQRKELEESLTKIESEFLNIKQI